MKQKLFSLLSIAALCLPFLASAQSLVVKSIEEERNATEASVNIRYDKSHNPCALVLVTIPGVPDATFEGMGIVDSFYSNYEYNVYVSEGTSEIRVKHPLAGERVIDFARQGIHIEPLKVYRALLYLEGAAGTPLQQSIDLEVMPQDAHIVFEPIRSSSPESFQYDGQNRGTEFRIPIGDYRWTATAAGYSKAEGRLSLTPASKHTLSIHLAQSPDEVVRPGSRKTKGHAEQKNRERKTFAQESDYPAFNLYVEPQALLSNGLMGAGAALGVDLRRINLELGGYGSFSTSEWITWVRPDYSEYGTYSYRPYLVTFKLGYHAYSNSWLDVAPQVGVAFLKTKATQHRGETNLVGDGANSLGVSAGCKFSWMFARHFHLTVTPQYTFRVRKSDSHELLEAPSMRMRRWNNTFSALVGISYILR